jgi:outer membrane protein insertion porin family
VSEAYIRANIRVRPGDPYQRPAVDDDIRNLYATGLFYNIRVSEHFTNSVINLIYALQAKPRLAEIKFSGNHEYSDKKLRKKVASKVGEPLDEQKLFTDSRTLQELYQKGGYPRTVVKYSVNIDENAGRGTALFEVTESPKIKIEKVEFPGASAFKEKKLRKQVKTRNRWWMSWLTGSGVYKEDQLLEDKERLAEFYRNQGYIDFDLRQVETEFPTTNTMVLRFHVFEGGQYKVGAVNFKGTTMFPTNKVDETFKLKPGAVFAPSQLRKDMETVEDFYGSKGHIDVTPMTGDLRVKRIANTETGTMDIEYNIEEGQKSFVEKIEIRGNTKTKDRVIRRELAISPGETFDMVRVKVSKRRLEGLQYFSKVETRADPTEVPNRKNLIIGVEEKPTGNVSIGAGFSSVDSLVGFAEYSQGNFDLFHPPNFTGGGQKLRLRLQLGTERQDYILSFVEPWFLGRKISFGVELYHRDLDFQSDDDMYTETRTGGRLSLTKALWSDYLIGSVSYTLENVGIDLNSGFHDDRTIVEIDESGRPIVRVQPRNVPQAILDEEGDSLVSKVGLSLAYDTRNSVLLPDAGQRTSIAAELASSALGGERDYYQLELKSAWYVRGFFKGHVLELTGRGGVTEGFNGDDVPFYDRFYLGGLYSLRGFKYRAISPREPGFDEPIGGRTYAFGSAEYSVPIFQQEKGAGVRFAVFYDIGFVNEDAYDFNGKNFSDDWGIGLRLNLPIGPLRLDYAFPINHDEFSDGDGRFQFGVGYTREF